MQNDLSNVPSLGDTGRRGDHAGSMPDLWSPAQSQYQKLGEIDDLEPAQGLLSSIAVSSLLWAILAFVPVIVRCTLI